MPLGCLQQGKSYIPHKILKNVNVIRKFDKILSNYSDVWLQKQSLMAKSHWLSLLVGRPAPSSAGWAEPTTAFAGANFSNVLIESSRIFGQSSKINGFIIDALPQTLPSSNVCKGFTQQLGSAGYTK